MESIGKYKIEKKIGSGGFGEVFKGYDPFIKRHVAVKTCISSDEEIRNRFFQEAEIAGNLQHRNITTVYDFGIHEGLPYLIQEYLSGEDLDSKIKRRDFLPYPEKLYYLLQIARGLAKAHAKGVIHRDIKPANIRVLEDGTVKIMDFGIAKLAQQESGLTQTGMTLGTAAYLAPEQIRGEAVDTATDIFSFGVLAYELLTSERPFQGQQISAVIFQVLHHEPQSIFDLAPNTPADLVALVERCLRKDAAERIAHGSALVKELEGLQKRDRPPAQNPAASPQPIGEMPTETLKYPDAAPSLPPDGGQATRRIETPRAAPTAAPEPAKRAAPSPDLEDISYSLSQPDDRPTAFGPSFAAEAGPRFRWSSVLSFGLILLMAGLAAGAGWWFGMHKPSATTVQTAEQQPAPASARDTTLAAGEAEDGGNGNDGAEKPGSAASAGDSPENSQNPVSGAPEVAPGAGATEADPPPPPPPPKPATGKLILPIVDWTEGMTVRINQRTYELQGAKIIDLPPGRYPAIFELADDDYTPQPRTVQIAVAAGKSRRLEAAIPKPGILTVRALPGRRQGQALIDGEPVGTTPLAIKREPGEYTVEIRAQESEEEGLTQTVRLESGSEVILSFDLAASDIQSHTKAR